MLGALHQSVAVKQAIPPDSQATGTLNGTTIDALDYGEAMFVLNTKTATGTADVKIQESADGSTWADVTGATFTQVTSSNDDAVYVGRLYRPARARYLRAVAVVATDVVELGVVCLLGNATQCPVSQDATVAFNLTEA